MIIGLPSNLDPSTCKELLLDDKSLWSSSFGVTNQSATCYVKKKKGRNGEGEKEGVECVLLALYNSISVARVRNNTLSTLET